MAKQFWKFLADKLEERSRAGLRRILSQPFDIDFSSNDYLGLTNQALQVELHPSGAGASRLIRGNHSHLEELEAYLATHYSAVEAVVFDSGYLANYTLFSAISQQGITVLYDELVHASIRDGMIGSRGKTWSFKHNDLADLERLLTKVAGPTVVVTEGLFSMDGDFGNISGMVALKSKYDFALVVDEAHATGWRGTSFLGESDHQRALNHVDIRIHTFGKALGGSGACLVATSRLRDFLVNYGRPLIYSTAPSPARCAEIRALHERVMGAEQERRALNEVIAYFNERTHGNGYVFGEVESPIRYYQVGELTRLQYIAASLKSQEIDARLILSPTVPLGSERVRICLHAFNTKHDIELLVENLQKSYIS